MDATAFRMSSKQTAIIANASGDLFVSNDVAIPPVGPDELLIKTAAVAVNPVDAKMVGTMAVPGSIAGCDSSGTVIAIGEAVTPGKFTIGDSICAPSVPMNPLSPLSGAFAEYAAVPADFALKIPAAMTPESAAGLCAGLAAIGLGLFRSLAIPGHPEKPATKPVYVLVYGGSSATGTLAIQLIRRSGLIPLATCSPHNFDLVRSYGAEEVWDYHDSQKCAAEIRAYTKNSLEFALDCHCEGGSMEFCYSAMGRAGGRYTTQEPYPESKHTRKVIKPNWVLGISLLGKDIPWPQPYTVDGSQELRRFGREWFDCAQRLLDAGELRPHPLRLGDEMGFEGVLRGIQLIKAKSVSGQKLVYRVAQ
ncbi:GroES-like protein [Xylaria cf. heliscus]|nr:GroES-like protein [Xylaria cf. heliscus]